MQGQVTNLLLVAPFARHGNGCNGTTVSVLAQAGSNWRSQTDDESTGSVVHAHGLQLNRSNPGKPESILLLADVDVGGAVLVGEGELLTLGGVEDGAILGMRGKGSLLGGDGLGDEILGSRRSHDVQVYVSLS